MSRHTEHRDEDLGAQLRSIPVPSHPEEFFDELRRRTVGASAGPELPQPTMWSWMKAHALGGSLRTRLVMSGMLAAGLIALGAYVSSQGSTSPVAKGGCASSLVFRGIHYSGLGARSRPALTGRIGTGIVPSCSDTDGASRGRRLRVGVYAVAGADPTVEIAVRKVRGVIFLANGYYPQTLGDPLRLPPAHTICRAEPPRRVLDGTVATTSPSAFVLRVEGADKNVRVSLGTVFSAALRSHDTPYLAVGNAVRVVAHRCAPTQPAPWLIAQAVTPTG